MKSSKQREEPDQIPQAEGMQQQQETKPLMERIQEATHNMQERLHNYHPFESMGKSKDEDPDAEEDFINLFG
ncbi:hypothetical protein G210_5709 [Candida maltosa Xu316]|uniref:Uncharacterized protein n=1 Tax=Candida maltosa (strain Xu316) TaxID=1245528 RepID=M3HU30_CANMX|nr:hypothetical protein G210_5709 [Candida maltosa Xu316]